METKITREDWNQYLMESDKAAERMKLLNFIFKNAMHLFIEENANFVFDCAMIDRIAFDKSLTDDIICKAVKLLENGKGVVNDNAYGNLVDFLIEH